MRDIAYRLPGPVADPDLVLQTLSSECVVISSVLTVFTGRDELLHNVDWLRVETHVATNRTEITVFVFVCSFVFLLFIVLTSLRCVIPVVCVTKWEVGAYSRTTQLIRRKDVLYYYEKNYMFRPTLAIIRFFLPIKGVYISEWGEMMKISLRIKSLMLCCSV